MLLGKTVVLYPRYEDFCTSKTFFQLSYLGLIPFSREQHFVVRTGFEPVPKSCFRPSSRNRASTIPPPDYNACLSKLSYLPCILFWRIAVPNGKAVSKTSMESGQDLNPHLANLYLPVEKIGGSNPVLPITPPDYFGKAIWCRSIASTT